MGALSAEGERLHDQALPQDEAKLRELFTSLAVKGRVLVVVDQPASIGGLAAAVARAEGIDIAKLALGTFGGERLWRGVDA